MVDIVAVTAPAAAVVYAVKAAAAAFIDFDTALAPISAVLKVICPAALATFLHTFMAGLSLSFISPAFLAAN